MDTGTMTEPLAQLNNDECNICFGDTSTTVTCGNEPCSFRSCEVCIGKYKKTHCPHCQRYSDTFHNIIRENDDIHQTQDFEILLHNRPFSTPDTIGCCLKIQNADGVTEYKLCNCNPLIDTLLTMWCGCAYISLSGSIINYFITGTLDLTPGTLTACCTNNTSLGCICLSISCCCCYLLEKQCQNTVIVTDNRYYRGTIMPSPAYMYMDRELLTTVVPPATIVPLSEDTDLP